MELPDKSKPAPPLHPQQPKRTKPIPGVVAKPASRPATRRFLDYVFAESPKEIGKKVLRDTIAPNLRMGIYQAAEGLLSGIVFGGQKPIGGGLFNMSPAMRGGGVNYNAISTAQSALQQAAMANQTRPNVGNYRDLAFPTPEAAELAFAGLLQAFNQYRMVAVADLWEIANMSPDPSMNAYGWHSLDGARIVSDRRGYVLELPQPVLL